MLRDTKIDYHCPMSIWPIVNLLRIVYCAVFSIASIMVSDRTGDLSLKVSVMLYKEDN